MSHPSLSRSRRWRLLALVAVLGLIASACGGGGETAGGGDNGEGDEADLGDPVRGGSVTYALEADTTEYCLSEAQLAVSGIMVARSVYDTLTTIDADGNAAPYLAESVEPNADFTQWTIQVREGVTFHDGSPLDAQVVKNNIDAYRGQYPGRSSLLFQFVLSDVTAVEVTDPMTVVVTTGRPWTAFDSFLHSSGRFGIMGQAQLDDPDGCGTNLVGTGPFQVEEFIVGQRFVASANPDYWQMAPDGEPYPYLEQITFVPVPDTIQRTNGLEAGEFQVAHTSSAGLIRPQELAEDGAIRLYESDDFGEVSYTMLNSTEAPFNDVRVRRAVQLTGTRLDVNEIVNEGITTIADGPFAEGSVGYLEDTGWPEPNLEEAQALIAEYEAEVGPAVAVVKHTTDPLVTQIATLTQEGMQEIGIDVELQGVDQAALISDAIAKNFNAVLWRNHPGGDPDLQYVWWHSTLITNFGGIMDPEVDRLLDEGRVTPPGPERVGIYEDLNRIFAEQAYNIWGYFTPWGILHQNNVGGLLLDEQPPLPDGGDPFPGLATGHPTHGIWVAE